jgi:hypothetical protein
VTQVELRHDRAVPPYMRVQLQQSCDARNVELRKKHDERIKRLAAEVRVCAFVRSHPR